MKPAIQFTYGLNYCLEHDSPVHFRSKQDEAEIDRMIKNGLNFKECTIFISNKDDREITIHPPQFGSFNWYKKTGEFIFPSKDDKPLRKPIQL